MRIGDNVYERSGADKISDRAFYFILGIVTLWGLGGTAGAANYVAKIEYHPGTVEFIILGLVIPIVGIVMAGKSDNPLISFIGYNMVTIPFGIILGPVLNQFSPDVIQNVALMTAGVTVIMICFSLMFPAFFSKIGGVLFVCLIGLLGVYILQMFIPGLRSFTIIDWIAAGIFSLYIGFDWWRATSVPRTLDNAVDVALSLYLDIVNLFLTLLRIYAADSD